MGGEKNMVLHNTHQWVFCLLGNSTKLDAWYLVWTGLHPWSLTWNLKIDPWKRKFLLETIIFRFHVKLWECNPSKSIMFAKDVKHQLLPSDRLMDWFPKWRSRHLSPEFRSQKMGPLTRSRLEEPGTWWNFLKKTPLGGGFKYFCCGVHPGEMIQVDKHMFQMSWNHQLDQGSIKHCIQMFGNAAFQHPRRGEVLYKN